MYKISMIIPVYNAEKYLKRTINSIINQSIGFENIELILVDDNSQDNSKSIIEEYVAKYDNVIGIYSNENHGFPGFGRNKGIEIASAQYIMFSDNDDEHDKENQRQHKDDGQDKAQRPLQFPDQLIMLAAQAEKLFLDKFHGHIEDKRDTKPHQKRGQKRKHHLAEGVDVVDVLQP